ncbi:hypothetical protein C7974DRAFT_410789 [Boeremia exigua]|uniref:uncharacterized protein n=1 Tax=Boeremia exigua TaxID=749465 RepID=UPI001E8E5376|nr:uncharacterized protein C7974DRAFT_410789 [Boeremia exigua]KAH6639836.1 hypothetical protein C7974DRAFT_410789 [Boeremia exigua]
MQSPFLRLPPEIRNKIYSYVFDSAIISPKKHSGLFLGDFRIKVRGNSMLRVCRQIHSEASGYKLSYTHVLLYNFDLSTLQHLQSLPRETLAKLRSLTFGSGLSDTINFRASKSINWTEGLGGLEFAALEYVYLLCNVHEDAETSNSPFLRLPAELRNSIYAYTFDKFTVHPRSDSKGLDREVSPLTQVSRQIRYETKSFVESCAVLELEDVREFREVLLELDCTDRVLPSVRTIEMDWMPAVLSDADRDRFGWYWGRYDEEDRKRIQRLLPALACFVLPGKMPIFRYNENSLIYMERLGVQMVFK